MIKIFDINKLTLDEILSRETSATGVEEIVAIEPKVAFVKCCGNRVFCFAKFIYQFFKRIL